MSDSKTVSEGKLGYDQIQQETVAATSASTRQGSDKRESRTDINRTSTSTQTGGKELVAVGSSKNERKLNTQTDTQRTSVQRVNLGFKLAFSIPLTGIIPTNAPGTNC